MDVIAGLQGDVGPGPRNNVVWVPSLAAAIVGDIAFNQVHLSLRATDADPGRPGKRRFASSRSEIRASWWPDTRTTPSFPTLRTCSPSTEAYLVEFEAALAASHNAGELVAAMKQKFPQGGSGSES